VFIVGNRKISSSDIHTMHSDFNMFTANRNLDVIEKLNSYSISYKDAYTYEFAILLFLNIIESNTAHPSYSNLLFLLDARV
jgi:hypothetical protein